MPARSSVAKASHAAPLNRLATNGGEKCGLSIRRFQLGSAQFFATTETAGAGNARTMKVNNIDHTVARYRDEQRYHPPLEPDVDNVCCPACRQQYPAINISNDLSAACQGGGSAQDVRDYRHG
jgi:hypothetical protein